MNHMAPAKAPHKGGIVSKWQILYGHFSKLVESETSAAQLCQLIVQALLSWPPPLLFLTILLLCSVRLGEPIGMPMAEMEK